LSFLYVLIITWKRADKSLERDAKRGLLEAMRDGVGAAGIALILDGVSYADLATHLIRLDARAGLVWGAFILAALVIAMPAAKAAEWHVPSKAGMRWIASRAVAFLIPFIMADHVLRSLV
jgi:hypothetical protein